MKFILIFGPQAVGKMTVGQELQKITGLKLFHNHMTLVTFLFTDIEGSTSFNYQLLIFNDQL